MGSFKPFSDKHGVTVIIMRTSVIFYIIEIQEQLHIDSLKFIEYIQYALPK